MKSLPLFAFPMITLCGCTPSHSQQESVSSPTMHQTSVASFLFEVKGYDGYGYRIVSNEGKVLIFEKKSPYEPQQKTPLVITPSKEKWAEFSKQISNTGANHWNLSYEPSKETCDGVSWKMIVIFNNQDGDTDVISFGRNAYPKDFNSMVDATSSLLEKKIDSPNEAANSPFQ